MINSVVLVGRMVRDPEIRYIPSGKAVTNFTLAVDNPFKKDDASFIRCQCWEKTAEAVNNYTAKGSLVAVTGRIQTRTWENDDGKKNFATEVVCDRVQFLDKKKKQDSGTAPEDFGGEIAGDEIPF